MKRAVGCAVNRRRLCLVGDVMKAPVGHFAIPLGGISRNGTPQGYAAQGQSTEPVRIHHRPATCGSVVRWGPVHTWYSRRGYLIEA